MLGVFHNHSISITILRNSYIIFCLLRFRHGHRHRHRAAVRVACFERLSTTTSIFFCFYTAAVADRPRSSLWKRWRRRIELQLTLSLENEAGEGTDKRTGKQSSIMSLSPTAIWMRVRTQSETERRQRSGCCVYILLIEAVIE